MRPFAPNSIIETISDQFLPAPELDSFVKKTFLDENSLLYNEDHRHLRRARIAYLWTNVKNIKQMREVVGTCEIPKPSPMMSVWDKARYYYQLREWFGPVAETLDFLITLNARYFNLVKDIDFLAGLDHELYHCGQKCDEFGMPLFKKKSGRPMFGLRKHDVEEFVGIWRRYGPQSGAGDSMLFVELAHAKPLIGAADISKMCGTCVG